MAKRRSSLSLERMESDLGYRVDALTYFGSSMTHFYADLRPNVPSIYERTFREFEELEKRKASTDAVIFGNALPDLGKSKIIAHGGDTVKITRSNDVHFYSFTANIHYNFELDLVLLFTRNEALKTIEVSQLNSSPIKGLGPQFSKLPRELREKIYDFAIPNGTWKSEDVDTSKSSFLENVGDPSGFYYPFGSLNILEVNKQMRQEALPLAYRRTMFRLDDMDELVKLLMAIGRIGRDSIESIEFTWQSRTDLERKWAKAPDSTEDSLLLPTLHVEKCLKLLRQCKHLKFLRIFFHSDLVLDKSPDAYAPETGIHELCSIRGIEHLEIRNLAFEPLRQSIFVTKLSGAMQSSRLENKN